MSELLKDRFLTIDSIAGMISALAEQYGDLNTESLRDLIYDSEWEDRELMDRTHHIARCLQKVLPSSYKEAVVILMSAAPHINGWETMALPDFVEQFGQEYWDVSLQALREFTKYGSSEFAIRPFIKKDPKKVMAYMEELAEDKNEHVRRFASEGCRPRLPWAMALPDFKKAPSLILPVLEKLKDDDSEYVRKSVANNLNDISKDHPDTVLAIAEEWYGHSLKTDWILKHACRTLLKKGNRRAMELFGFGLSKDLAIKNFHLDREKLKIGEAQSFSFTLENTGKKALKVRLEYAVYFMKANGELKNKVFQISEKEYAPGSYTHVKKHKFANLTTRKHYPGLHKISLILNGEEIEQRDFQLLKA